MSLKKQKFKYEKFPIFLNFDLANVVGQVILKKEYCDKFPKIAISPAGIMDRTHKGKLSKEKMR